MGCSREPVRGGMSAADGYNNLMFVAAKSFVSRLGMPAVTVQVREIMGWIVEGRGELSGRMRRRSQDGDWVSNGSIEVCSGRIIQRTTLAITRGRMVPLERAERNVRRGTASASRWRAHTGIVGDCRHSVRNIGGEVWPCFHWGVSGRERSLIKGSETAEYDRRVMSDEKSIYLR